MRMKTMFHPATVRAEVDREALLQFAANPDVRNGRG